MSIALAAILGAITGSFLNVVVYRVPRDESVVFPPSHCPSCNTRLGAVDLVPVFSFLLLGGRCRHCGVPLSPRYVIIELAAAVAAAASFLVFGPTAAGGAAALLLLLLLALSAIDLEHFLLPDRIVAAGIITGLPLVLVRDWPQWGDGLAGMVIGGALFLLIVVVSRGGMGGGDVKLAAMIGLYLGWRLALVAFGIAFIAGGVIGLTLLVAGVSKRKDHLPFGPFLALGAVVALFFGHTMVAWYLGVL